MNQIEFRNTEFCFICNVYMSSCRNKLAARLGHSNKSLFSLIESFIEQPLPEDFLSIGAAVCQRCMIRINEYDQLTTKAAQLKHELIRTFRTAQECSSGDLLQSDVELTEIFPGKGLNFQRYNEASVEESPFECNDEVSEDFRRILEKEGIAYDFKVFQRAFGEDQIVETEKKMKRVDKYSRNCKECPTVDCCKINGFEIQKTFTDTKSQFHCATCDISFRSADGLRVHLSSNHGSITKNIPCPYKSCQKSFVNKVTLKAHFICHNRDEKEPSFICDICGKGFHYKLSFTQHNKIHSGIRDKECESCGFKAISSTHLKRHIRARHTKEKNHICSYCNRAFSERYNMTSHIRKQHIEKKPMKNNISPT